MHFTELCQYWGIALTGGIASGKSTVAEGLRRRGFVAIDADQVSRLVVLPGTEGLKEVVTVFGRDILTASGEMDRAKLRGIVFQTPALRTQLEEIIFKRLGAATEELLLKENLFQNPRPWFYEASLIYERQRARDFSQVWVAFCPRETQIQRLMLRDGSDRQQAEAMLASQMPAEDKAKQADLVIDTDCDKSELEQRIDQALRSTQLKNSSSKGV